MEKMLVTQALNELKTLDARIYRATTNASFVAAAKTENPNVTPSVTKEKFIKDAKASLDSIKSLIARRDAIKTAVVASNANTIVKIGENEYTVAKAIEMKNSIQYHRNVLSAMKRQRDLALSTMNSNNSKMEDKLDKHVETIFGKEGKNNIKQNEYDAVAKPFRAANEFSLVDPLHIDDEIEALERFIEDFDSNVDSALQVSNCTNYIEL